MFLSWLDPGRAGHKRLPNGLRESGVIFSTHESRVQTAIKVASGIEKQQ